MPTYCGYCDLRYSKRDMRNRPVNRATHVRLCTPCYVSRRPHRFPACEWCSRNAFCSICKHLQDSPWSGSKLMRPENGDTDSSDDDDKQATGEALDARDVRIHPPRFCPGARTRDRVPHVWRSTERGWHIATGATEPFQLDRWQKLVGGCTGCGLVGPMNRVLFDVLLIYGGQHQQHNDSPAASSTSSAATADLRATSTERYRHKLCVKCAVCVVRRPMGIRNATFEDRLTFLQISPTVLDVPDSLPTLFLEPSPPDAFDWSEEIDDQSVVPPTG